MSVAASPSEIVIAKVITVATSGSYYFEDLATIRQHRLSMAARYHTPSVGQSYPFVRTPASALSFGLVLSDGQVAWGDITAVSFAGKSGRDPLQSVSQTEHWLASEFSQWIQGQNPRSWLENEKQFLDAFSAQPAFVRYGVSQALAQAASLVRRQPAWRMFAEELTVPMSQLKAVPLQGSSGADFGAAVDRMLARRVPFLPQGQFEDLTEQIGEGGARLLGWVADFKRRCERFHYVPTLTLDFHGALDEVFGRDIQRIAGFLDQLVQTAHPHPLHVESALMGADFSEFVQRMVELRSSVKTPAPALRLMADEWANSVDDMRALVAAGAVNGVHIKMPDTGTLWESVQAVRLLQQEAAFVLLGGSCNETMHSARLSTHLALVLRPDALLVKPGMGFDEACAMIEAEMACALKTRDIL